MKKALALILTVVMSLTLLTACMSDPVADEFEKFVNVDMVDVNAAFEIVTDEATRIADFESNDALLKSINETLIPNCEKALDLLSKITLETEEVKALRDKFADAISHYKEGFEYYITGFANNDADTIIKGNDVISEGVELVKAYNDAALALAEEKGFEFEE